MHMNTTKAVQSFEIRLFLPYHPISFSVSTFILAFLGYYLEQYKYPLSRLLLLCPIIQAQSPTLFLLNT